ncbi:MAG: hypothetical protein R3284_10585 [Rubricoccaceae bacterium]|nr:hypothetical protein [Rubricoccaceae bacterium]
MKPLSRILLISLFLSLTAGCSGVADRVARGVERGAERAAEREASRQADQAITGVMRTAEGAIICIVTDEQCIENARRNGEAVEVRDRDGNVVETYPAPDGVNVNSDFRAGSRVLFYEDYSNDPIGNFPSSLEFVEGNWEIVQWQGRRLLRNTGPRSSAIRIILPEALPQNFTLETEIYFPGSNQRFLLFTQPPQGSWSSVDYNYFVLGGNHGSGVNANSGVGLSTSMNPSDAPNQGLVPYRIMVEGDYAKVYVGGDRTANIPNAYIPRTEALQMINPYYANEETPMYLGPIRIATD